MIRKDTLNWIALAEYDLENSGPHAGNRSLSVCDFFVPFVIGENTQSACYRNHAINSSQNTRSNLSGKEKRTRNSTTIFRVHRKINTASIPTRYPEDLQRALSDYPKAIAEDYLHKTQEIIRWLKQHPNLNP